MATDTLATDGTLQRLLAASRQLEVDDLPEAAESIVWFVMRGDRENAEDFIRDGKERLERCRELLADFWDVFAATYEKPAKLDRDYGSYHAACVGILSTVLHDVDVYRRRAPEAWLTDLRRRWECSPVVSVKESGPYLQQERGRAVERWERLRALVAGGGEFVTDSPAAIARLLKRNKSTVNRWVAAGKLRAEKITSQLWRVPLADIERMGGGA